MTLGINPARFNSTTGMVSFEDTPFLGGAQKLPAGVTGDASGAPAAPVLSTAIAAGAPAQGVLSKFTQSDAGAYYYAVVACNNAGASAPVQVNAGAALTVSGGQAVTFGVTPGSGPAVQYYKVFRTPKDKPLTQQFFILDAKNLDPQTNLPGTGEVKITDDNAKLPGTYDAVGLQFDRDTVRFLQLGSLIRVPMAVINTSLQWMLLLSGTPSLKAPNRCVLIRNVGLAATAAPIL
jgi:hypothetical protein